MKNPDDIPLPLILIITFGGILILVVLGFGIYTLGVDNERVRLTTNPDDYASIRSATLLREQADKIEQGSR